MGTLSRMSMFARRQKRTFLSFFFLLGFLGSRFLDTSRKKKPVWETLGVNKGERAAGFSFFRAFFCPEREREFLEKKREKKRRTKNSLELRARTWCGGDKAAPPLPGDLGERRRRLCSAALGGKNRGKVHFPFGRPQQQQQQQRCLFHLFRASLSTPVSVCKRRIAFII